MYLETEDLHALLVDLASFAATGSKLIINFAAPSARTTRHNRTSSRILSVAGRVQGERFLSARDIDDPAGVIAASGWRVDRAVSLHELAPVLVGPASGLDLANVSDYARTVVAIHADS